MVTFDANGGVPTPPPQIVGYGRLVYRPIDPVREGYVFAGWYPALGFSTEPWNFEAEVVTSNMTLIASWTQVYYDVTFNANDGVPTPATQVVPYGGLVSQPAIPVRAGYVFEGWYPTADFSGYPWYFPADMVTHSMTLYARWREVTYQVNFNANGGTPTPPTQSVRQGAHVTQPNEPTRAGYAFAGWYQAADFSGAPWNFASNVVTGNMTLYARWTQLTFAVTFDTNGGTPVPSAQIVAYGALVTRPTDPIRDDYVFVAWYPTPDLTGIPWSFAISPVTQNMTLYARWLQPV